MKNYLILLIALLGYANSHACSTSAYSFCFSLDSKSEDVILTGEIVSIDTLGIDLKVIEVLRGEETRSIVRIWDGTDYDCNGNWSMAALDIGDLQDTIVIILPKIKEKENDWDVLDDYRRPNPYQFTTQLTIEKGYVKGFIQGHKFAPIQFVTLVLGWEEFSKKIIEDGDCTAIVLSTDELKTKPIINLNNPFTDQLIIQLPAAIQETTISIYSVSGQVLYREEIREERNIAILSDYWPSGMYVLELRSKDQLPQLIKVIKL